MMLDPRGMKVNLRGLKRDGLAGRVGGILLLVLGLLLAAGLCTASEPGDNPRAKPSQGSVPADLP